MRQGPVASPDTIPDAPTSAPSVKFTTPDALLEVVRQASSGLILFSGVSLHDYANIEKLREEGHKIRVKYFDPAQRVLFVKIPSGPHEVAYAHLYQYIFSGITSAGLQSCWKSLAATQYRNPDGGSASEGDSAGGPRFHGKDAWPSLVIEAGASPSSNFLRSRMRWWFQASQHQVNIVLLVILGMALLGRVTIEKWKEVGQPRQGATHTRAFTGIWPGLMQTIVISRPPNAPPQSYHIASGGALRLEFSDLFLRPPQQGESDAVVSIEELQELGALIWEDY